ncbi:MAG: transporter substrate-binding domain-containing protein [Pseudomonas sp.]|uniref:substrate-binding periplasmic protein n=1 Tax=Pseudomonas sp. TaxID=306 RepID=UPI0033939AAB
MGCYRWGGLLACLLFSSLVYSETWHVATEEGYQPYNYTDPLNGGPTGLDVELVTAILDDVQVAYDFKMLPWERVKRLLSNGQVDLAFQFLDTPERRAQYLLVGPFREGRSVFACRRGCAIAFSQLSDLRPYSIATVAGYAYGSRFDDAGLKVDSSATRSDMLPRMLVAKRVDLIVGDQLLLQTIAAQQGVLEQLEFLPTPLSVEPRYVGFRQGGERMAKRFQRSLDKLKANGTLEAIIQRWTDPALFKEVRRNASP